MHLSPALDTVIAHTRYVHAGGSCLAMRRAPTGGHLYLAGGPSKVGADPLLARACIWPLLGWPRHAAAPLDQLEQLSLGGGE